MPDRSFFRIRLRYCAPGFLLVLCGCLSAAAQSVAILTPEPSELSTAVADDLEGRFETDMRVVDRSLAASAFAAVSHSTPFNMALEEARTLGSAIGCDSFILLRAGVQRRSSFKRPEYYDAYAVTYAVSSRTGRLIDWQILKFEEPSAASGREKLMAGLPSFASAMSDNIRKRLSAENQEPPRPSVEEVPEPGTPEAKGLKAPIPFNRIKPQYTELANLYEVTATVDIEVDLDAAGRILRTEVVRWAGYGLDESVEKAVRAMNWRPADRNGKSLPMRFLLRYNFKKVEREPLRQ